MGIIGWLIAAFIAVCVFVVARWLIALLFGMIGFVVPDNVVVVLAILVAIGVAFGARPYYTRLR